MATSKRSRSEMGSDFGPGATIATTAGLLGLLAAARNPASSFHKLGKFVSGARYASMLSGLATPKSILGNVGAAGTASLERRSMAPLKELFSRKTASDIGTFIKHGTPVREGVEEGVRINPIGRVMGAFDEATRNALERAGLTEQEAERLLLRSPEYVSGGLQKALDTPVGEMFVPFRRTPFNVLGGGFRSTMEHPGIAAGALGAGAALGAGTDTDPYVMAGVSPITSVYTLPFLGGAALGRYVRSGGKRNEVEELTAGLSPVPEYSFVSGLTRPVREPAAISALRRIMELR